MGGLWFRQVFHQCLVLAGLLHCGCKSSSGFVCCLVDLKSSYLVLNHTLVQQQHTGIKMHTVCETAELKLNPAILTVLTQ